MASTRSTHHERTAMPTKRKGPTMDDVTVTLSHDEQRVIVRALLEWIEDHRTRVRWNYKDNTLLAHDLDVADTVADRVALASVNT